MVIVISNTPPAVPFFFARRLTAESLSYLLLTAKVFLDENLNADEIRDMIYQISGGVDISKFQSVKTTLIELDSDFFVSTSGGSGAHGFLVFFNRIPYLLLFDFTL